MTRRILLVGAGGAFGSRLADLLSCWDDVILVLAARRIAPLESRADTLRAGGARAQIEVAAFDRERPEGLEALAPWAVVDAAGPFQASDLRLPRAAIAAGSHYVDIADGRAFVASFPAALDAVARTKGVLAVTGASSTPALSNAAIEAITQGWREIARIVVAISPGARAPRGVAVVRAILSYVGRPVRVFRAGRWVARAGWSGPWRLSFPGLGRRWVSLCETPDLDLIAQRFAPTQDADFRAGLELSVLHLGLWLLSWPVRWNLVRSLVPLAPLLRAAAGLAAPLGSDRGGMVVVAEGRGADGQRRRGRWSLVAEANAGPTVPVAAAAAMLRALKDGRLTATGAQACVGLLPLADIVAELRPLRVRTQIESCAPDARGVFRRALGDDFPALPTSVARVHGAVVTDFAGRARARGARSLPARLLRKVLGVPDPGAYPEVRVTIAVDDRGETWTRRFGAVTFSSRLRAGVEPGRFEERFGPLRFAFEIEPSPAGFIWRFRGWRLGPVPLPTALAPRIRARAVEVDGGYRFRVLTAHPLLGVLFAYAGRLE